MNLAKNLAVVFLLSGAVSTEASDWSWEKVCEESRGGCWFNSFKALEPSKTDRMDQIERLASVIRVAAGSAGINRLVQCAHPRGHYRDYPNPGVELNAQGLTYYCDANSAYRNDDYFCDDYCRSRYQEIVISEASLNKREFMFLPDTQRLVDAAEYKKPEAGETAEERLARVSVSEAVMQKAFQRAYDLSKVLVREAEERQAPARAAAAEKARQAKIKAELDYIAGRLSKQ